MYPSVGFAFQAQGYVSKGRRFLSDAPIGRFSMSLVLLKNGRRPVKGGPPLQAPLAMYPFGIMEGPNGTSLAMYPSVGFAFEAQGYVSKGRRFLSDAPLGWFP